MFVIIVRGHVTLLTNASRYMDMPIDIRIEGEEAMLFYMEENSIMLTTPALKVSNRRHLLKHLFHIYLD